MKTEVALGDTGTVLEDLNTVLSSTTLLMEQYCRPGTSSTAGLMFMIKWIYNLASIQHLTSASTPPLLQKVHMMGQS